jgi:hypothetical protein
VEWTLPSGKVRNFVGSLAIALALYGGLRWAGFYEFASRDAEGLATLTQLLGDIYAVLLAFTIFVIWGQFTEVENCVIRECNSFDELLRFSRYLNADDAANIRRTVKAYRGQVLDHEWQALGDGRSDRRTEELFVQFITAVVETTPRSDAERAIHVRLLDMVQKTNDRRDERVAKSLTRIPPTLAGLVNTVAGALVLSIFVYPFRYWVTGAACFTLTACVIWLANRVMMDTDNPLKGIWNVSPRPFADLKL